MTAKAIADNATNWATTRSDNKTNQNLFDSDNNDPQLLSYTDATDEWKQTVTAWANVSQSTYNGAVADNRQIVLGAPTGTNDYWETDPAATQSTALDSSHRVTFTQPYLFTQAVTMTASGTKEGATAWTQYDPTPVTNQTKYNADNVSSQPNVYTNATDEWTRTVLTWSGFQTLATYNAAQADDRQIVLGAPTGTNDYWETDPAATQSTALDRRTVSPSPSRTRSPKR